MTIVALPGFLGTPSDWTTIIPHAHVPDIPLLSLWESSRWLNEWASSLPPPRLLAGYSLGGRLALHALIKRPDLWSQAVILSAHTGLKSRLQKELRLQDDLEWARRFREDSWGELMAEWNQRGALQTSAALDRLEADYSREKLSHALDAWSLGRQDNLQALIEEVNIPIAWLTGERDSSFCQIACALKFKHFASRAALVPACGHRLLHDNPQFIKKEWPWKL